MIQDIYKTYVDCASTIDGFKVGQKEDVPYDITELANACCKARDEHDSIKECQYISALMVRYWHMVVFTWQQSKSTRLEIDDIASWIYEAIDKALRYRSWLDKTKSVSKDPRGAEKVINRCIYSIRNYWYANFNKDKRKINYTLYSLNTLVPGIEEPVETIDVIPDSAYDPHDDSRELVQRYIYAGDIPAAIFLDQIMYQDCFTQTLQGVDEFETSTGQVMKKDRYDTRFSPVKLVKAVRSLNEPYLTYLTDVYDVGREDAEKAASELSKMPEATIRAKLKEVLEDVWKHRKEFCLPPCS